MTDATDAVERLRTKIATGLVEMPQDAFTLMTIFLTDARAILAHIDAIEAEREAARAEIGQVVAWLRKGAVYRQPSPPNVALFNRIAVALEAGQHRSDG